MKLTNQNALDLLKTLGIQDVELVADDAASDYSQDAAIQLVDAARTPIISQKILTEETGKIHGEVAGKINNAIRNQLHKLTGVSKSDIEGKNSDEAMQLAFAHWAKTTGGDKEAFAAQLNEVMASKDATLTQKEKEWADKYGALESKYTRKEIMDGLNGIYATAKGIKPTANKALLAGDFLTSLESEAIVKYNSESKEFELYDKTNPAIRLLDKSKNGFAKVEDRIKEYHSARDQWHEDARQENAVEKMNTPKATDNYIEKDGKISSPLNQQMDVLSAWAAQPA